MTNVSSAQASELDRDLTRRLTVNWELVAWVTVFALALLTRLWGLGDRAMSHDESLHTYYSWKLFMGEGYVHDPMMHGPLLYHFTALMYFLFGASDLTARLLGVVSGLGLVLSPLLLRKWLGNVGALATGVILLLSPTVMYYSRYIRHDIPVELFTVLLFAAIVRYVDDRSGRWLVLAFVAAAGGVTSAEMSYINMFVIISFLAIALVVERMSARLTYALEVAMVAIGAGVLVYASLGNMGRIPALDFTTEGSLARTSMQVGFLAAGVLLIYGLISPLLSRPRPSSAPGGAPQTMTLGDVFPHALARASVPSPTSLRLLAGGGLALVVGVVLLRLPDLSPELSAASRLAGLGSILMAVGWFSSLCGLIGRLAPSAGRRADLMAVAVAVAATAAWGAFWWVSGGELGVREGPGIGNLTQGTLLLLTAASAVVLLYACLGWLLRDRPQGGLGGAVAAAPLEYIGIGAAAFLVIYTLLFTTFFTNSKGIYGFVDSIRYWLRQHEVVRGGQPWYYYSLFLPMYELLSVVLAVAGTVVYGLRPRLRVEMGNDSSDPMSPSPAAWLFVPGLVMWSAGVFWIYSWAGEKMPWLLVHMAVPLAFLAGRTVNDMIRRVDWVEMRRRGWMVAGLLVLLVLALIGWAAVSPLAGQSQEALARTSGFLIGIPIILLIVWALWRVAADTSRRQAWLAAALVAVALLFVWDVRTSVLANFVNAQLATEYIVYAHGTPDDKEVYRMLQEMQARVGVQTPLSVGYDNEVSWPWTWYFRYTDFPGAVYLGEKPTSALTYDAVLVGSPNYGNFEPYLRDRYVSIEFRRMWWPNEGYKGLTPSKVLSSLEDPKAWRNVFNILVYRRYTTDPTADVPETKPLSDWYHLANMRLYIKRDLIQTIWPLVQARPDWVPEIPEEAVAPSRSVSKLTIQQTYELGPDGQPLLQPKGIALGPDGNLYVVDQGQDRVVVFDQSGQALEQIGADDFTYTTQDGTLDHSAWGVGVGPDGAVYVADTWNHRVVKYMNGQRTASFGQFGNPSSSDQDLSMLFGPRDIAVGPDGNVLVTDTGNDRIIVLTPDLKPIRALGGSGVEAGKFDEPTSLAFDPDTGDLFVADEWNFRIQRFDKDLNPAGQWPVEGWESQEAAHKAYIAVGAGMVVASDPSAQRVWVFDRQGTVLATLDLPADPRGLDQPIGVAVDAEGRIYVASSNSSLVTRYAPLEGIGTGQEGAAAASPSAPEEGGEVSPTPSASGQVEEASPTATASSESGGPSPTLPATGAEAGQGGGSGQGAEGPTRPSPTPSPG
jgi:predicted membrane-bound mannosyltransferase/sugar lactone lactonase YvrE